MWPFKKREQTLLEKMIDNGALTVDDNGTKHLSIWKALEIPEFRERFMKMINPRTEGDV